MFTINKYDILTTDRISKIIQSFETNTKNKLKKYENYYKGNQDILMKMVSDTSKPCNRIVTNYCYNIVNNYLGYLTGIPITYTANNAEAVQDILNINDVKTADSELLRRALIYGKSYEVHYLDEQGQHKFKMLDSKECIPVYDNTLNHNLLYVIRYYQVDELDILSGYYVDVYSTTEFISYGADSLYGSLVEIGRQPHYFKQVPINIFYLNTDEESIFDKIITLQDAYNTLLSSEVDDFQAFCDAYLVLKGLTADSADIATMKENRILLLEADASAEYLNKSITDTQIENLLSNINDTIHKISNSPDFNDEKLLAQSGIAMRYKLVGFENTASAIVSNMSKVLQNRIKLITSVTNMIANVTSYKDFEIKFTRNLPVNETEIADIINKLRGVVSDKTLISLLPFVSDVDKELAQLEIESATKSSLYSIGGGVNDLLG